VFDEMIFPFSELHLNAGNLLRSKILLLHLTLQNLCGGPGVGIIDMCNVANPCPTENIADIVANDDINEGVT
jgi:hypothetical protein